MKGYFFDPQRGFVNAEFEPQHGLKVLDDKVSERDVVREGRVWSRPFIDLYAFLPDPGYEYREDVVSFAGAARAGGYGAVMCRPCTLPVIDNASVAQDFMQRDANGVRLIPMPAFSMGQQGKRMAEMGDMAGLGLWGVTNGEVPVRSDRFLRRVMEYARNFGLYVVLTPFHPELGKGQVNEGPVSARLGLRPDSWAGEAITINRYLVLAQLTGASVHIAKVSTGQGVEAIRRAKQQGVNVTASVAFYNLLLTDEAMEAFDQNLLVNPPLRSQQDRQALLEGVRDGTIDAVVSDHTPVAVHEKELELDFAVPGMIGLEFVFPALMGLVRQGELTLTDVMRVLVKRPMEITGISPEGLLQLDMESTSQPGKWEPRSRSRNTPFDGHLPAAGVKWVAGD